MEGSCVEDGGVVVELHLLYDSEASCTKSVGTDLSMEEIGHLQAEVRELRDLITSLEKKLKQQAELSSKEGVSSSEARLNPPEHLEPEPSTVLEMEDECSLTLHCYGDLNPEEAQGSGRIDQRTLQDVEKGGASVNTHCTVLQSEEPPPAAKRCSKCCSKFHCPFCPPTVYKPRHDAYSVNRHLQCHLKKAVRARGYVICMCHLGCRPSGHFHCPICSRTILRKDGAQTHISSCQGSSESPPPERHAEDSPHICSYCGKLLKTKHNLINHLRIHTGEKPHLCPQCGKQFSSQGSFLIHQRTHSAERPYACSVCGKGFKRKSEFSVHQRRHTGEKPYLCATCGKQLASRKTLSAHQKTHTGERPHHCFTCGKSFVLKSNLTAHRGTHTRLYNCAQCGRTFGRLDNLKVHQRTHAKQNP